MVKIGQPITPVAFSSPVHPLLPVEVIDRAELLTRTGPTHFGVEQRPSFDYLMLMGSGRGVHTIDFVEIPARAGRLVRLRAGQSHVWGRQGALNGADRYPGVPENDRADRKAGADQPARARNSTTSHADHGRNRRDLDATWLLRADQLHQVLRPPRRCNTQSVPTETARARQIVPEDADAG